MTTTDLWIRNLSGGRSLYQHGGLSGPALDTASVLLDFIAEGKATAHPDHHDVCDIESVMSGAVLLELLRETEKRSGRQLVESDGVPTISCVVTGHRYEITYIEF